MRPNGFLVGFVNFFVGLAELILGLRFILRFFNANPSVAFVQWIYSTSSTIMAPFRGIFPVQVQQGYVLDFSALFAMLIYAIVGYLLVELLQTALHRR